MDLNTAEDAILNGSGSDELKTRRIDRSALNEGVRENDGKIAMPIVPLSNLPNTHAGRLAQIAFHSIKPYVAV